MISDIANMIKSGFSSLVFESNEDACITNTFHCSMAAPPTQTEFTYPVGVLVVAGFAIVSAYALKLYTTKESIKLSHDFISENEKSVPTMENERAAMALADSESMAAEETERARLRAEKKKRRAERAAEKAERQQIVQEKVAAANAALEQEAAAKRVEQRNKRLCTAQNVLNQLGEYMEVDPEAAKFLQDQENNDPMAKKKKGLTWRDELTDKKLVDIRTLSAGSSSSSGTPKNGLK